MSYMMLHGLGDCTPAHHCGCLEQPLKDDHPRLPGAPETETGQDHGQG